MDQIKQIAYEGTDRQCTKVRIRQLPPADYRENVEESVKLHLGCGIQKWSGWINIDGFDGGGVNSPDITGSIVDLPDFKDGSVDEIALIHVFEHLHTWKVAKAMKEWFRILKKGGKLIIEVPCLNKILKHFQDGNKDPYMTFFGLYGEQSGEEPEMNHKWCYSEKQLVGLFNETGFTNIQLLDPVYHRLERDMRVVGEKP